MAPPLFLHLSKMVILIGMGVLAIFFIIALFTGPRKTKKKWPIATGSLILALFFLGYGGVVIFQTVKTWRESKTVTSATREVAMKQQVEGLERDLLDFMLLDESRRLFEPKAPPADIQAKMESARRRLFLPGTWAELEGAPWDRFKKYYLVHPAGERRLVTDAGGLRLIRDSTQGPAVTVSCMPFSNELKISEIQVGE